MDLFKILIKLFNNSIFKILLKNHVFSLIAIKIQYNWYYNLRRNFQYLLILLEVNTILSSM